MAKRPLRPDRFPPALLAEYEEVLGYERIRQRHGMSAVQVAAAVRDIQRFAVSVDPQSVPAVIAEDPDDDHVLACAVAGQAGYIVSGDSHLLNLRVYQEIRILSPAAFATLLAQVP